MTNPWEINPVKGLNPNNYIDGKCHCPEPDVIEGKCRICGAIREEPFKAPPKKRSVK